MFRFRRDRGGGEGEGDAADNPNNNNNNNNNNNIQQQSEKEKEESDIDVEQEGGDSSLDESLESEDLDAYYHPYGEDDIDIDEDMDEEEEEDGDENEELEGNIGGGGGILNDVRLQVPALRRFFNRLAQGVGAVAGNNDDQQQEEEEEDADAEDDDNEELDGEVDEQFAENFNNLAQLLQAGNLDQGVFRELLRAYRGGRRRESRNVRGVLDRSIDSTAESDKENIKLDEEMYNYKPKSPILIDRISKLGSIIDPFTNEKKKKQDYNNNNKSGESTSTSTTTTTTTSSSSSSNGFESTSSQQYKDLYNELVQCGFKSSLITSALKYNSTMDGCIDWISEQYQIDSDLLDWIKVVSHSSNVNVFEKFLDGLKVKCTAGDQQKDCYQDIKDKQKTTTCGKVFKLNEWGFQCNQCQEDATSILCESCFRDSNHEGHEYQMVRVGGGGCCDCGDSDSWKEEGFCSKHKDVQEVDQVMLAPIEDLGEGHLTYCERVLGYLLDIILNVLRNNESRDSSDIFYQQKLYFHYHDDSTREFDVNLKDDYYGVLIYNDDHNSFQSVSKELREAIGLQRSHAMDYAHYVHMNGRCIVFIGKRGECQRVTKDLEKINLKSTLTRRFQAFPFQNFISILELFIYLTPLPCFKRLFCNLLTRPIGQYHHDDGNEFDYDNCRLKLFFIYYQYLPSSKQELLKNWLFSLTFDRAFKIDFSVCFAKCYPTIMDNFGKDIYDHDTSLLSLTIQIFTIPYITTVLVDKYNILETILGSLDQIVEKHLLKDPNALEFQGELKDDGELNSHHKYYYYFERIKHVFYDIQYILAIYPVMRNTMNTQPKLFAPWLNVLTLFHLSNPNIRNTVTFSESSSWINYFTHSFTMEKHTFAIFSSLIEHNDQFFIENGEAIKNAFNLVLNVATKMKKTTEGVSFHLPIHRALAKLALLLVRKFVGHRNNPITFKQYTESLYKNPTLANELVYGIANIDNFIAESNSRMWLKNGSPITSQIFNYNSHSFLRYYFFEPDFFLKQILCCSIGSNSFIKVYFSYFKTLSINNVLFQTNHSLNNHQMGVLSNFYRFLITCISERSFVGDITDEEIIKYDIIHRLYLKNRTFTKLVSSLGLDRRYLDVSNKTVEKVLKEVANYISPSLQEQGKYALKPEFSNVYNKYYSRYSNEERERSEESFSSSNEKSNQNKLRRLPLMAPIKQEFRAVLDLLYCEELYRMIFYSLYQCVVEMEDQVKLDEFDTSQRRIERTDVIDHLVHLLFMAVDESNNKKNQNDNNQNNRLGFIIDQIHKKYLPSNVSTYDLLQAISTDQSKKYFHPSVFELIALLEKNNNNNHTNTNTTSPSNLRISSSAEQEDEEKQRKMMEAKKKIMEQFSNQQKMFSSSLKSELDDLSDYEDEDDLEQQDQDKLMKSEAEKNPKKTCILCREETYINDQNNPIGNLCLVQRSRLSQIMSERHENKSESKYHFKSKDQKDVDFKYYTNDNINLVSQFCGHSLHYKCFKSLESKQVPHFVICPLCTSYSNAILPPVPKSYSFLNCNGSQQINWEQVKSTPLYECYEHFQNRITNRNIRAIHLVDDKSQKFNYIQIFESTINSLEYQSRNSDWNLARSGIDEKIVNSLKSLLDVIHIIVMKVEADKQKVEEINNNNNSDEFTTLLSTLFNPNSSIKNVEDYKKISNELIISLNQDQFSTPQQLVKHTILLRRIAILDHIFSISRTLPHLSFFAGDQLQTFHQSLLNHITDYRNIKPATSSTSSSTSITSTTTTTTTTTTSTSPSSLSSSLSNPILREEIEYFHIIPLSINYDDIFSCNIKCKKCDLVPSKRDQVVCLLCGSMVCASALCCRETNGEGEVTTHSRKCGGDIGVYLLVEHSIVLAFFDGCIGFIGSPYLDAHGEEDAGLKRGAHLKLSNDRYELLSSTILKHEVPKAIRSQNGNINWRNPNQL